MGRSQRHMIEEYGANSRGEFNSQGATSSASGFIVDPEDIGEVLDNPNVVGVHVPVGPSGGPLSGSTLSGALPVGPQFPRITGLDPLTAGVEDEGSQLTVYGANFNAQSVILFAGEEVDTAYVDAQTLTAEIEWGDYTAGPVMVVINNDGFDSNPYPFDLTAVEPEE